MTTLSIKTLLAATAMAALASSAFAQAAAPTPWVLAPDMGYAYEAKGKTLYNYGHSMVIDPWGHVVARASDGVGIVSSRLDLAMPKAVRARMPVAEHRRLGRAPAGMAIAAE